VVSLPSLLVLKLFAWRDRRFDQPFKDAHDLNLIVSNYATAIGHERVFNAAGAIVAETGDPDLAGAWLAGFDMASVVSATVKKALLELLEAETDEADKLSLAGDMAKSGKAVAPMVAMLIRIRDGLDSGERR
ncbi:MAG: hypothetical protein ACPG4N_12585, partial [Gammaproteobacteria bacterium]